MILAQQRDEECRAEKYDRLSAAAGPTWINWRNNDIINRVQLAENFANAELYPLFR